MEQTPLHNSFDKQVQETLARVAPAMPTDAWARMAQQLDDQNDNDAVFDQHIAASLVAVSPEPAAWQQLQARLDKVLPTSDMVDQTIREKVNRLQPSYKEPHWRMLEQQLNQRRAATTAWRRRLALQTAAAILFLISVAHLWIAQPWLGPLQVELAAVPKHKTPTNNTPQVADNQASSKVVSATYTHKHITPTGAIFPQAIALAPQALRSSIATDLTVLTTPPLIETPPADLLADGSLVSFDLLQPLTPRVQTVPELDPATLPALAFAQSPKAFKHRLSVMAGPTVDVVAPPRQDSERLHDVYSGNYTVGMSLSVPINNRWSVDAGLAYDNKNYRKPEIQKIGIPEPNNYDLRLKTIVFRMVRIPVLVRQRLVQSKHIDLYASTGLQGHLTLQSSFNRIEDNEPIIVPEPPEPVNTTSNRPVFMQGVLEGGDFQENFSVSAIAGLGLDWHIHAKTDLFIQPTYSHALPIGMNNQTQDRFHTFAVLVGLRQAL
jgi:hypothetical protein